MLIAAVLGCDMAQCPNPITVRIDRKQIDSLANSQEVPCGRCIICRSNRARMWMLRLKHELELNRKALYVTLTYNDDCVPVSELEFCLYKRHLQLYFKRLRKSLGDQKIRYYAVGEYGRKTGRPHYHAIIFGTLDVQKVEAAWKSGFVKIGAVTPDSIAYVCGYVIDKLNQEFVVRLVSEFSVMSKGLGLEYATKYLKDDIYNLNLSDNGHVVNTPRYYQDKLGVDTVKKKL